MKSLVMKDLSMLRYKWLFSIVAAIVTISYGIASVYEGSIDVTKTIIFQLGFNMAGVFMVFLFCVLMPLGYEEQNKSENILRSLPVNNGDIAIAKYIYTIIIFMLWVLVSKVGPVIYFAAKGELTVDAFQLDYILIAALGYGLLASIYLPLHFKFGYLKMRYINVVLYLIIVLIPSLLSKLFSSIDVMKIMKVIEKLTGLFGRVEIFLGCLIGVIYIISCMISVRVSKYREA